MTRTIYISNTARLTGLMLVMLLFTIITISSIFKIEIVARGKGRVVPESHIQVIQSELNGSVQYIFVNNGSEVKKNTPLIQLDTTEITTEYNTLKNEIRQLKVSITRIDSLVSSIKHWGSKNKTTVQHLKKKADLLFNAEIDELSTSIERVEANIKTNQMGVQVIIASMNSVSNQLILNKRQYRMSVQLLKKGAISKKTFLNEKIKYDQILNSLEILQNQLEEKQMQKFSFEAEKRNIFASTKRRLLGEKLASNKELLVAKEKLKSITRKLQNMTLRAPKDGQVEELKVFTINGVVKAGETLMKIVPAEKEIIIEILIANSDIGFIKKDQIAYIKFDAYPSERFGYVKGKILNISSDAKQNTDKTYSFVVRVIPDSFTLKTQNFDLPLLAGMTATVDVVTGERRIISYFFAPIVKAIQDGMKER